MTHPSMVRTVDVVVVGGGMAGVSIAYEMASRADVVLLEQEPVLAHHTTGRSAAAFLESYGNTVVRALTRASRAFFEAAPEAMGTSPLLTPRPLLRVGRADQADSLDAELAEAGPVSTLEPMSLGSALDLCPVLDPAYLGCAAVDRAAMDVDVMGLHAAYTSGLRRRGGAVLRSSRVLRLRRSGSSWQVETGADSLAAGLVVNAAGAWADVVAAAADLEPVGLQPKRRTIAVCSSDRAVDAGWPLVVDVDEQFYFKPEGDGVLASPEDETPVPPGDARPDDVDVALALDRVNAATTLGLRHVRTAWAGLRTFAPDRCPVVGRDPRTEGFAWFAGQGGYGIQMAPALARVGAALTLGEQPPQQVLDHGVDVKRILVARLLSETSSAVPDQS